MKNSRGWGRISKRGRNWRARITDGHGHELHRTFPTRDDAEKWLRARRDEKITGRVQRDAVARVDQLVERYRVALDESTLSAATRTWQRRCLRDIEAMLGAYQLAGLTPGHLDDFNRELRRQSFAPGSIRLRFATLRALLRFAVRHGYIEKAPDVPVQPQLSRTPPAAKPDEIEAMLKAARKHDDPRVELALALAAFAGLRRSDILRLCGRDADLDLGVLTVPVRSETDAPKGRKTIRVPIAPKLASAIRRRAAAPDERLLHPITTITGLRYLMVRTIGQPVRWHELRRAWITRLLDEGVPVPVVQSVAGHSAIRTTLGYWRGAPLESPKLLAALGLIRAERGKRLISR